MGCQFVTFVLKQHHCSLTGSYYLSFASTLPNMAIESFLAIEVSTPLVLSVSLTYGALLRLLPAGASALSRCLGLSCGTFPSVLIGTTSAWPGTA